MKIKKLKISDSPNSRNLKILAIGDPHGDLEKVKKIPLDGIELILLTGDLGSANLARKMFFNNIERKKQGLQPKIYSPNQEKNAFSESYNSTMKLVKYLAKFAPVYTIFGNVEHSNSETREKSKEIGLSLPFLVDGLNSIKGVRIINNRIANFQGVRIGGLNYFVDTNWVKDFKPSEYLEKLRWAKIQTAKAQRVLNNFGNLDVLVCHQPPYKILDKVTAKFAPKHWQGKHAGSQAILKYINKYHPKYVFCGHIHEQEGVKRLDKTEVYNFGSGGYKILDIS